MRLPNSYGSVFKLKGNRRKPWVARKTEGWKIGSNGNAQPVYRYVGYYETRAEALRALAADAGEDRPESLTLEELHARWWEKKEPTLSDNTLRVYRRGWEILAPIWSRSIDTLKLSEIQTVLDRSGANTPTLKTSKAVLSMMYKFGVVNDLVPAELDKIAYLDVGARNPNKRERKPFTSDEIRKVWEAGDLYVMALILTGCRVGELLALRGDDIHEGYFTVRQSKTAAGVRDVPIPSAVADLFKKEKPFDGMIYMTYLRHFNMTMKEIGAEHTPHDTRHTFISLMTGLGIDERIIKQIVGHKSANVTEAVYTHIDIERKREAVEALVTSLSLTK